MILRRHREAVPFTTTDGSTIRSLLDCANAPVEGQSLAEATLGPGERTERHHHRVSEEIYYLVAGGGLMEVDGDTARVEAGDAILIPPGAWHQITNDGDAPLVLLCCCAPPWRAEDTHFA